MARYVQDGTLGKADVHALSALTGKPRQVAAQVYQHELNDADLQAAGVTDTQDRQTILSAVRQALLQTNGAEWEGYDAVAVDFTRATPKGKRAAPAAPTLPEVTVTARSPSAPVSDKGVRPFSSGQWFTEQYAQVSAGASDADRQRLTTLLHAGTLGKLDSRGFSVLDHLYRLSQGPVAMPDKALEADLGAAGHAVQPYTGSMKDLRQDYLSTLLAHLADPASVYQGQFGTCAATMAQVTMVSNEPAAYAGMVADLVGPAGVGRMPSGEAITRSPESLIAVNGDAGASARPRLSIIVQTALMEMNSSVMGTYSNVDDKHWRQESPIGFIMGGKPQGGTTRDNQAATLTDVTGIPHMPKVTSTPIETTLLMAAELNHRRTDTEPICHVGMYFSPSGMHASHAIGVTELTADRVYYRNPWGNRFEAEKTAASVVHFDEARQQAYIETARNRPGLTRLYADGTESLDRETFVAKVHTVFITD
jgi:hypothetical protein